MKLKTLQCLFLSSLISLSALPGLALTQNSPSSHKRALLIAAWKYKHSASPLEPADLNTKPDTAALKSILTSKQYGFAPQDVVVIDDPLQTTHKGILTALDKLAEDTHQDDIVYFHYSGHGSQVPDSNNDELDGMDETLLPTDYDFSDPDKNPTLNEITDDEIQQSVKKIMAKQPKLFMMSFDCCQSADVVRDNNVLPLRGFKYPFPEKAPASARRGPNANDETKSRGPADGLKANNLVCLYAAGSTQSAHETVTSDGKPMGLFSMALCKALVNAGPKTTYSDLLSNVESEIISRSGAQNAEIQGARDNILFTGIVLPPQPAIVVENSENGLILKAGRIHGMTDGSTFAIYPADTKDFKSTKPVATTKISYADVVDSVLASPTDSPLDAKTRFFKARELNHEFSDDQIPLRVEGLDQAQYKTICDALKDFGQVKVLPLARTNNDDGPGWRLKLFTQKDNSKAWELQRRTGAELKANIRNTENNDLNDLKNALRREYKFQLIENLSNSDPDVNVELRVVPVRVKTWDGRRRPVEVEPIRNQDVSTMEFPPDQYFTFEIRNKGVQEAYVNIVDMQPDGSISVLYPHKQDIPQIVAAGDDWKILRAPDYVFKFDRPYGTERFKLIATSEKTKLADIFGDATCRGGSGMNPIERLMAVAVSGVRAATPVSGPSTRWSTYVTEIKCSDPTAGQAPPKK